MEYLIPSHLKLNLTLRVTDKRLDGFHEIHSLFLQLPGAESLVIRTRPRTSKDLVRVYNYPVKGQNIIFKTLCLLRSLGIELGPLEVDILKAVPPGTGLGRAAGTRRPLLDGLGTLLGWRSPGSWKPRSVRMSLFSAAEQAWALSPRPEKRWNALTEPCLFREWCSSPGGVPIPRLRIGSSTRMPRGLRFRRKKRP